jgi:hypothetical protein
VVVPAGRESRSLDNVLEFLFYMLPCVVFGTIFFVAYISIAIFEFVRYKIYSSTGNNCHTIISGRATPARPPQQER